VGCGVVVTKDRLGRLTVEGDEDHPSSRGMLCSKGRTLHHVVQQQSDRLLYPQLRRSRAHPLERVSWDTALDRAAAVFKAIIQRHGPEAVGFYVSGQCLTEEYYIANKLMKGFIGCNNIDTNSRLCMSSAVAGYKLALGDDACPVSYADIELGDCFMIAGANPAWCHPILFRRLEQHKVQNPDIKVIVVDPRRTPSCAFADLHLQLQPGTDVALFNAIARELHEQGHWDEDFVATHCSGIEALKQAAFALTTDEAAEVCRVDADDIRRAAHLIGTSGAFQTWWAMGLNQSSVGVDKNVALLNLSLLTGQIGKPGAGPFSLTGQPNAMGGREVGGLANLLAAHRDLADPDERAFVQAHWNSGPIAAKPGLTATEMFDALESGAMKAIWIICTNPAVSMPNLGRVERALKVARFVVVQDISSLSDTVPYADLVLPAAGWLEKQGTMTNSERRVTLLSKLADAPGEALPDVEILCRFAQKMGWAEAFTYPDESAIFDEHRALTKGTNIDMTGISYARLRAEGSLQWPCPGKAHPGTQRLFEDHKFFTPDQRARLHGPVYSPSAEATSEQYPLILTTGRIRDQWHTMTRTGKVNKLRQHLDTPYVELHPDDADAQGISEGHTVTIYNDRGAVRARAVLTDAVKSGVVFLPMHWGKSLQKGDARANVLTSPLVDPRAKEPEFKFAAVALSRVPSTRRRVLVVGGGTAALAFAQELRKRCAEDEIIVFGKEPHGFYNRSLLPDLISGECSWSSMQTAPDPMLEKANITFYPGRPITAIHRKGRFIVDATGERHTYDKLVLATGSQPQLPPECPINMAGLFTLRTRADADAVMDFVRSGTRCVVAGGGLLGLELVAALRELGAECRLLHRSGQLMGRQLDATASQFLAEELEERGVTVHVNDSIASVYGEGTVQGVRTQNGVYYPCDAVFFATGTTPNIALARTASLPCRQGVLVDDGMRTEDPGIFAIGEIAEHRHRCYGTTPAAQAQAVVAAAQLAGDTWTRYSGSISFNVLKLKGLALCTMGDAGADTSAPGYEEIVLLDRSERLYQKCIVRHNRLVGAILYGDTSPMAELKGLIESQLELDEARRTLLRGTAVSREPLEGPLVCSCNQVGEGNLLRALAEGCDSLESLCAKTGAGTGCGSCRPELGAFMERSAVLAAG
jgi:ferredoxin-nitrate reductase